MSDSPTSRDHAAPASSPAPPAASVSPAATATAAAAAVPILPAHTPGVASEHHAVAQDCSNVAGAQIDLPPAEAVTVTGPLPASSVLFQPQPVSSDTHVSATPTAPAPSSLPTAGVPADTTPPGPTSASLKNSGAVELAPKRPRHLMATQSANRSSLLTQALASARGIPPQQTTQPDSWSIQAGKHHSHKDSAPPHSNRITSCLRTDKSEEQYDTSTADDGGSLTLSGLSQPITTNHFPPVLSSSPTSMTLDDQQKIQPMSTMSTSATITETLSPMRSIRPLPIIRGRSLERTEKELSITQNGKWKNQNIGDTSFSHVASDAGVSASKDEESSDDPRSQYRSWRAPDHPVSLGPEKAWSIDTGDSVAPQDGPVEKSITEALAGVEPTRSRKASHSLRFFKEGLPDEISKKRDSKTTARLQNKLSPTAETPDSESFAQAQDTHVVSQPPSAAISISSQTPHVHEEAISTGMASADLKNKVKETTDYFGTFAGLERAGTASNDIPSLAARLAQSSLDTQTQCTVVDNATSKSDHRKSDASTGQHEDCEDSSEEKISSALFVPHQAPEGTSPESSPSVNAVDRPPPTRRQSTKEDFNSWLVKADDPDGTPHAPGAPERELGNENLEGFQSVVASSPSPSNDCAIDDDDDIILPAPASSLPKTQQVNTPIAEDLALEPDLEPKQPLEAIELIPYKHQVGGHTTVWRFSKKAVCKQLNNRENEFYENIERYHRKLLPFLPRYIGVLNVTFRKQPRRKSVVKREEISAPEHAPPQTAEGSNSLLKTVLTPGKGALEGRHHRRVFSQSAQTTSGPAPTVTFVDNQHILPRSLLQPNVAGTERTRSASMTNIYDRSNCQETNENDTLKPKYPARPALEDRHANSWGATTVNKRLRNEVFNDAFLKEPVTVRKHKTPASHQRSIPRRAVQHIGGTQSQNGTDSHTRAPEQEGGLGHELGPASSNIPTLSYHQSDMGPESVPLAIESAEHVKDMTGTSAPEPDTLSERFPSPRRKRRYSGSGLRRRPQEVNGTPNDSLQSRGDLQYFEGADDAGYRADTGSTVVSAATTPGHENKAHASQYASGFKAPMLPASGQSSAVASELPSPIADPVKIPRPINPKEAQTQQGSRVEYFLLLEDLTAGMKKPCIMDLKMGTRQYGVEASSKKRDSQRRKCAATTSRELGVRVCGLQTWNAKTQNYVFKDKYWGRDLKAGQEFQDALTMFLYDGVDYSSVLRHIPVILQKLSQLEITVRRLGGYRFYAASLLMFYDADPADDGYDTTIEDSTTDVPTDAEDGWDNRKRQRDKREIDFKMADFANSVVPGDLAEDKPCPPQHPDQPDRGFLRGLMSLRHYFLRIQRDVRAEMGLAVSQRGHPRYEEFAEEEAYFSTSE